MRDAQRHLATPSRVEQHRRLVLHLPLPGTGVRSGRPRLAGGVEERHLGAGVWRAAGDAGRELNTPVGSDGRVQTQPSVSSAARAKGSENSNLKQ